jgi:hypothetical protein
MMTQRPLGRLLTQVFDSVSNELAGGRVNPADLLPGADDPNEGSVPAEFLPGVETFDWFDPTVWSNATPDAVTPTDLTAITAATGAGTDGEGLDWFRAGEAPNNYVNRNNPLYVARKDFIVSVAPKLEQMFDVSVEGSAGYYRPPAAADAAPGGRSPNSDHYSAGAVDVYGTPEQLTGLRDWLVEQPWTAFVRYASESHQEHLHLSVDLGWVANNYYGGNTPEPPSLTMHQSPPTPQGGPQ